MVSCDKNGGLTCQLLPTDKLNASDSFRPRQLCHHFNLVVRHRLQCTFQVILYWNPTLELQWVLCPWAAFFVTRYESVFEQRLIILTLTFDLSYFTSVNGWDLDF